MVSSKPAMLKLLRCRNSKCCRSPLIAPTTTASPHASSIVFFAGLIKLESLNLDSCRIGDEGLISCQELKCLKLSYTKIGSNGLHHISGLPSLEKINLSFTMISDGGLRKLSGLSFLKSLNLDARQITDSGLETLTR